MEQPASQQQPQQKDILLEEHLRQHAAAMSHEPPTTTTTPAETAPKPSTVPQTIKGVLERSEGALERARTEKAQTEEGRQVLGDMKELVSDVRRMEEERHVSERATRVGQLASAVGEEVRESPATGALRTDVRRDIRALSDQQRAELPREKTEMATFVDHTRFLLVELARSAELRSIVRELADVFSIVVSSQIETGPKMEILAQERDQVLNRLYVGFLRIGASEHYRRAISEASQLVEQLQRVAYHALRESKTPQDIERVRQEFEISPNMQNLINEAKELVAAFAGGDKRVLDNLSHQTNLVIDSTIRNRDFHRYIQEWRQFVWQSVMTPDRLSEPEFRNRAQYLLDNGKPFFQDNRHLQDLFREIRLFVDRVKEDPLTKKLADDQAKLIHDMAFDEKGELVFKRDVLDDLRRCVVPILVESLKEVQLSDIRDVAESALGSFEYEISNIKLSTLDILPEYIGIKLLSKAELLPKELEARMEPTLIKIVATRVNLRMQDVRFWYRRIAAPHAQDSGSFDVEIPGDGLEVHIIAELAPPSVFLEAVSAAADKEKKEAAALPSFLSVQKVTCTVHQLSIQFLEAKFAGMYNILSKLFSTSLKRAIARRIAENIISGIETMDRALCQVVASLPAESARDTIVQALKTSPIAMISTGKKKAKQKGVTEGATVPFAEAGARAGRFFGEKPREAEWMPQFAPSGRTLADLAAQREPSRETFPSYPQYERPYEQPQPWGREERPYERRQFEERPYERRQFEERPYERRQFEERPYQERQPWGREERPYERRQFEERPYERRQFEERPYEYQRPSFEERPSFEQRGFWPRERESELGRIPSGRHLQEQYRPPEFGVQDRVGGPRSLADLASSRRE